MQVIATLKTVTDGSKSTRIHLEAPAFNGGMWYVPMTRMKAALTRLGDPKAGYVYSNKTFRAIDKHGYGKMVIYESS